MNALGRLYLSTLCLLPLCAAAGGSYPHESRSGDAQDGTTYEARPASDTTIRIDRIQVTAIKQGPVLRAQPVASTVVGVRDIRRQRIHALKELSQSVPNLHIPDYGSRMTASIYVRGLGARIDQPVIGLNVDNVPVLSKDNFDTEIADAERIEVLRGPQSTLYGRNTMGGVVNIYTLSPLSYQGLRLMAEYGSGNTQRYRASVYVKLRPDMGMSLAAYRASCDGFFENRATGRRCDDERTHGGRWKFQWRNGRGVHVENTFSFSTLDQGGYPYAYVGEEKRDAAGNTIIRPGEIRYNDPSTYRRTALGDGLTIRYDAERYSVSAITAYQYSDDEMVLDQDFLPLSYFTLRQARREHAATEDIVIRSRGKHRYGWLVGAFGFYRNSSMEAPVEFKRTGIEELILKNANDNDPQYTYDAWDDDRLLLESDFDNPTAGGALYHESTLTAGRWRLTAGVRFDYESSRLHYRSHTRSGYTATNRLDGTTAHYPVTIDLDGRLRQSFTEVLPKFSVLYDFDSGRNLYLSLSKGYKAGGFNTQMFSDLLQQTMMQRISGMGASYDADRVVSYRPEYSWNYELGGHFSCMEGAVRGDFALFWIDCRDQQLTVFPEGTTTGRMMTNAGRTCSRGAELALRIIPGNAVSLDLAYGYTDARFRRYENSEKQPDGTVVRVDYRGNRIPYAPAHTLSAGATWTIPTGVGALGDVVLYAGMRGTGPIYWNESNTRRQPFYALFDVSARLEHARYSIDFWARNLTGAHYDVFYFKSMANEFVQRGKPRRFGVTLHIHLQTRK